LAPPLRKVGPQSAFLAPHPTGKENIIENFLLTYVAY
jgi:hypothetical protein